VLDEKERNDEVPGRETQRMRAAEMIVEPRLGVAGFDFAQPAGADPDGRSEVFLRYSPNRLIISMRLPDISLIVARTEGARALGKA
jgi:hypothetical protein